MCPLPELITFIDVQDDPRGSPLCSLYSTKYKKCTGCVWSRESTYSTQIYWSVGNDPDTKTGKRYITVGYVPSIIRGESENSLPKTIEFSFILSNVVVDIIRVRINANAIRFIRDLKQTDAAAVRRWPTIKSLFKRAQGQVNSLCPWHQWPLIEWKFACWPPPLGRRVSLLKVPTVFEADVETFEIRITVWRECNLHRWHFFLRISADWKRLFNGI